MLLRSNHPVVTSTDKLVIVMADNEPDAFVEVKSLTANVSMEFRAFDVVLDLNGSPIAFATSTVTIAQKGVSVRVDLPISPATPKNKVTEIVMSSGQCMIDIVSPSPYSDTFRMSASTPITT